MASAIFNFGPYRLDPAKRELSLHGDGIALPPRAYDCLLMLVELRDRAVARSELIGRLWHHGQASDIQLGQLILQCRRAVGDDGQSQQAIRTIAGYGYRWVADTREERTDAESAAGSDPAVQRDAPTPRIVTEAVAAEADQESANLDRPRSSLPVARANRPLRRGHLSWLALLLAAVALAFWALPRWPTAPPAATSPGGSMQLLVLPLDAPVDDGWIRLGGMDLVIERLRRAGLQVLPSDMSIGLVTQWRDDQPFAEQALHSGHANHVVTGSARRVDGRWQVQLDAQAASGLPRHSQADGDDAVQAIRVAADQLAGVLGHALPRDTASSPPLTETLSRARAALLAGEPEAARTVLLADPALTDNQPLLRLQLAEIDLRTGRFDEAERSAGDLLDQADPADGAWRGQLLNVLASLQVRRGDYARAGDTFSEAIQALGDSSDPLWIGRAYLGRGVSRTAMQDITGAMADYGRASDAFGRAGDSASLARIDNNIGALELLRGHPARAVPYLQRGLAQAQPLGLVHEHVSGLRLLATAQHDMLDHGAAFATIEAAWAMRDRFPNPNTTLSVTLFRIRALLQLGRLSEAGALIAALPPAVPADPSDALLRDLLAAEQLSWLGRHDQALARLQTVADATHAVADQDALLAQIAVLRSRLERRLGMVRPAPDVEPDWSDTPRRPLRWLAEANRAWTRQDPGAADRAFREALAASERLDVRGTTAAVVADYVPFLLAGERLGDAIAAGHRVAIWAGHDFTSALVLLHLAHARSNEHEWRAALEQARQLAGERPIDTRLTRWR